MSPLPFNAGRVLEPNLWAQQEGVGTNLDITSGQPCVIYALSISAAGQAAAQAKNNTRARFYDATTNSGNFIELWVDDSINYSYTLDLPWGIRFGNGLSIDMVEAADHTVHGDIGWAYAVYKVIP